MFGGFGIRKNLFHQAEEALGVDIPDQIEGMFCGDEEGGGGMSRDEMIKIAFTEALKEGIQMAVSTAMKAGGFSNNHRVRIPWPEELGGNIESAVQRFLPDHYDTFVSTLNQAAEQAAETALDVLIAALEGLDLSSAMEMITSQNPLACTDYFRDTSSGALHEGMRPIVDAALDAVSVTNYWDTVCDAYASIPAVAKSMSGLPDTICTDLGEYATQKAVRGLLVYVGDKEVAIRENPMAAAHELVQQVFDPSFFQ
eukprot:TRINITY_DN16784_c0_g1_i1.p1 TRINITY_DN16784_c0_g1~~TRINITY_DN16784_c0_g1_i1.p1  ORF type:complete len:281 (+),score=73.41 TRINITY_DN16784_c0_g1_i1:80-844(+)